MIENSQQLYFFFDVAAFIAILSMHVVKTNRYLIRAYILQSFVVASLLLLIGFLEQEQSLIWIGTLTFAIKVVAAPAFFFRLKKRFDALFTPNNYLSLPLTLVVLMFLIIVSYSSVFQPLYFFSPETFGLLPLCLAMVFLSVFLMINRRGAFSQMIGILSVENSIVLLATLIGIKQPIALEMGIIFDIAIWMIIAQVFISMIYRQFGSLNVTQLKKLIEE